MQTFFLRRVAEVAIKDGDLLEVTLSDGTKRCMCDAKEVKFLKKG